MSDVSEQETLPRDLTHQVLPERISDVVSELCNLKLSMDRHARGLVGQPFLDDWMTWDVSCSRLASEFSFILEARRTR